MHSFTRGLDLDIRAATAAVTLPHHNRRTEEVNTEIKTIKKQMYGRAGFTPTASPDSPRMRLRTVTTECATEPHERRFRRYRLVGLGSREPVAEDDSECVVTEWII